MIFHCDDSLKREWEDALARWRSQRNTQRIWSRDQTLWTGTDESAWLQWLEEPVHLAMDLERLQGELKPFNGCNAIVVLGMGGSSLWPEVMSRAFPGPRPLWVLDSTDPDQIRSVLQSLSDKNPLVIISSKSGTTIETISLMRLFESKAHGKGSFLVITDSGTSLQVMADAKGWKVFNGHAQIGGRFSALSPFGFIPFLLLGGDGKRLVKQACEMRQCCRSDKEDNPGVRLGLFMACAAQRGYDKLTFVSARAWGGFEDWLEQLIAESTGKDGKGILPVSEPSTLSAGEVGPDRVLVFLDHVTELKDRMNKLQTREQPLIQISLQDPYELGAQIFLWEFAVAVAGAILHVHPFIQPDVESAKRRAQEWTTKLIPYPTEKRTGGLSLFPSTSAPVSECLRSHFSKLKTSSYLALQAFVEYSKVNHMGLLRIKKLIQEKTQKAVTIGFGPRFLHSTGQYHKGGPRNGVFLQITCDASEDLLVPDGALSFAQLKMAQAMGDFDALDDLSRPILRVHLRQPLSRSFEELYQEINKAF